MWKSLLSAAAAVTLVASAAAVPAHAETSKGALTFTVLRKGSDIGTFSIAYHVDNGRTYIDSKTHVAVKIVFVTAYRFEQEEHEVWQGGHLARLDSKTDDDGKDRSLHVKADGNALDVDGSAAKYRAPLQVVPASLWNPATVQQTELLNTIDGKMMKVAVRDVGRETVKVAGQPVTATHYAITGDLKRDLWYDARGRLVQVAFLGDDGSKILYVLR